MTLIVTTQFLDSDSSGVRFVNRKRLIRGFIQEHPRATLHSTINGCPSNNSAARCFAQNKFSVHMKDGQTRCLYPHFGHARFSILITELSVVYSVLQPSIELLNRSGGFTESESNVKRYQRILLTPTRRNIRDEFLKGDRILWASPKCLFKPVQCFGLLFVSTLSPADPIHFGHDFQRDSSGFEGSAVLWIVSFFSFSD